LLSFIEIDPMPVSRCSATWSALLSLAALLAVRPVLSTPVEDRSRLLEGVHTVAAPGLPGSLALYGPTAFPVVVGKAEGNTRVPVVAGARLGRGRVVALAHDGYFNRDALESADTGRLLLDAIRWAAGEEKPRIALVGLPALREYLSAAGLDAKSINPREELSGYRVVVVTHQRLDAAAAERVRAFVEAGGGVVAASTGWGWAQITGRPITEHPLSAITRGAGIVWTDGTAERTVPGGFEVTAAAPPLVHAGEALSALLEKRALDPAAASQCSASVLLAARSTIPGDPLLAPRLQELRKAAGAAALPGERTPVSSRDPLRRVALALDVDEAERAAPEAVRAHPAAADFPGAVPADAPRVTRRLAVDLTVPGWCSTGLYAAPGERVTLALSGPPPKGLALRIGAHTDQLWHLNSWKRAPAMTRSFPVRGERTVAACAFGGPVYVVVPDQASGKLEVTLSGGVEAPYFRLGETSAAEWKSIRTRPAPWAELQGEKVIFTVPSSHVRALEDPEALLQLWDRAVRAEEELACRPARKRPERIVADRQISAGYMHSGYPIMTPIDDSTRLAVDETRLRSGGSWGHLHELGHNLQSGDWTFDGTGEVTNNVLAMYVYSQVLKLPFDSGHPAIRDRAARLERVKKHLAAGAPYGAWKSDPFLALSMYIQVIDGLGWDPLRKVFAEYRALPAAERPRGDDQKRDQWLVRLSRAAGKNLGPFFQTWGVPTSEAARASVKDLPAWMPAELASK
jgi:hypothetical protein